VTGQTTSGDTPLHQACYYGHSETARVLLKHGASVNVRNDQGRSPFDEARSRGNTELIALLQSFISENSIEKWRKKGYTFIPSIRPKVDNLSTTTGISGQFEIITDEEIQREKCKSRSHETRAPCESLEPFCETGPALPLAVKNISVDTKVLKNGLAPNASERRGHAASVFLLDQNQTHVPRSSESRSVSGDTVNCPKCGHLFRPNGRHIHANTGSTKSDDVITRVRNDYALLSRMFYEVQVDLVKEREENMRLKTVMKYHNAQFHQGQSPDLLL
jgi:hypothetical protein